MKCVNCNVEMIEDCVVEGQHPFELGADGSVDISVHIPTNEQGSFLGFKYNKVKELPIKARICPKCGRIELYTNIDEER